jgi:hypothetical protein
MDRRGEFHADHHLLAAFSRQSFQVFCPSFLDGAEIFSMEMPKY